MGATSQRGPRAKSSFISASFKLGVAAPVLVTIAFSAARQPSEFFQPVLLVWASVVATVDLLAVPVSTALQLSLSFPILLGVAILYSPIVAGAVALIGSFDSRELKRGISPLTALFNRCQIALAVYVQSWVFHHLANPSSPIQVLVPSVLTAYTAAYCLNVTLVSLDVHFGHDVPIVAVLRQMRVGALSQFLMNVVGLGFIGIIIARLYLQVQLWSVAAFILPLVFARQMFFRSKALEEASKELKDRERVLRALSNRLAEERQDERMQIAGYLHDDLAQMLFRLTLQAEMAKKRLLRGDLDTVAKDIEGIIETKQKTSDMVRALIKDLHRSPIGRRGLAEALESFAEDMSKGQTKVWSDVVEVSLPPPIQLLIYQISREAVMNALKHAEAENIRITLKERDEGVELQIADDGRGFDTSQPQPEGHFGSVMMRERAIVTGGTFKVESEIGTGTTITATFPQVWVEEGSRLEGQESPAAHPAPDATPTIAATKERRAGSDPAGSPVPPAKEKTAGLASAGA